MLGWTGLVGAGAPLIGGLGLLVPFVTPFYLGWLALAAGSVFTLRRHLRGEQRRLGAPLDEFFESLEPALPGRALTPLAEG